MNTGAKELLSLEGYRLLEDLCSGKLTERSFHSKKWYAKDKGNLKVMIDLASAWEVYKYESK